MKKICSFWAGLSENKKAAIIGFFVLCLQTVAAYSVPFWAHAEVVCDTSTGTSIGQEPMGRSSVRGKDYAQPYTPTQNCSIVGVTFNMDAAGGSPTPDSTLSLETNAGGQPSGTVLTSQTITSIGNSDVLASTTYPIVYSVTAGTEYWLVLSAASYNNSTAFGIDSAYGPSQGNALDDMSGSWSATNDGGAYGALFVVNGAGGSGSATSSEPAAEIFASSTMAASGVAQYDIVDNPTEDLFDGFIMFSIAFFGMVWLMRKH